MTAGFIHQIDPVLGQFGGMYLWWYGLSYTAGFLSLHLWLRRWRERLSFTLAQVYGLTLSVMIGVLVGGRLIEVFFYEWPFYRDHLHLIPAFWLGGMATHGLLLGGILGAWIYCLGQRRPFLPVLDHLAIPAALIMGLGRIGNFIDGQIVGSVTDAWWAVKFPDAEGYRHPVVLYDGLKNLLLVPWLLYVRRQEKRPGIVAAHFIFWYGFLRIFVDLFREYPTTLLGLATGQSLNIAMALTGVVLFAWCCRKNQNHVIPSLRETSNSQLGENPEIPRKLGMTIMSVAFVVLLIFCATIPSDWTQDVPSRYGNRHAGLAHTKLYPAIAP